MEAYRIKVTYIVVYIRFMYNKNGVKPVNVRALLMMNLVTTKFEIYPRPYQREGM